MGDTVYSEGYYAGNNLSTDNSSFEDNGQNGEEVFPSGPIYDRKDLPTKPGQKPIKFEWMEREDARAPLRPKSQTLLQFISKENIAYLKGIFEKSVPAGPPRKFIVETLTDAVYEFQHRANDLLESDPIAVRGENRPASDMWSEVRRLNRAFYADRMKVIRELNANINLSDPKAGPRELFEDEDQPYAYRMFVADSLRPAGLEHLNSAGPLFALLEDQAETTRTAKDKIGVDFVYGDKKEGFGNPKQSNKKTQKALRETKEEADPMAPEDDIYAWFYEGDPNRTPEQAILEFWGGDEGNSLDRNLKPVTKTALGIQELAGETEGEKYAWGDKWLDGPGTRFMRYQAIPFWQRTGTRDGIDHLIEETLGTQMREDYNDIRRFDTSRVTKRGGQEYRRYGARNGYVV